MTDKMKEESIMINPGSDGTGLSNAIYDTVFSKSSMIVFKRVENYSVPPHPENVEWGK